MKKKTVTLKDYIMAISIFLIALVVGIFIFYSGVQHSIAKNSQERISTNVSRQSEHLRTIFDINYQYLNEIAWQIGKSEPLISQNNIDRLEAIVEKTDLERVALIEPDGTAHYDNAVVKNLSYRRYFKEAMSGKETLSDPLESSVDQQTRVVLGVPIYNSDNEIVDQSLLGNNLGNIGVSVEVKLLTIKSVPLSIDTSSIVAAEGFSIADIIYAPQEIQIAGEEGALDSFSSIEIPAEAFDVEPVSKKTEMTIDVKPYLPDKIKLVDENGNLILVTVTVEKDGTKSFNLPVGSIAVKNLDDNLRMNFVSQDDLEVHVRGNEDVLESISIEHAASIDLKDLNKAGIYTVPVKINLPGGCTLEVDVEIAIELEEKQ